MFVSITSTKSKERSKDCPLWYSLWNEHFLWWNTLKYHLWEGLVKEHLIQPRTLPLIPICSSFNKGLWCGTLSNGLLYKQEDRTCVLILRRLCDLFWLVNFKYLYLKSSEMNNRWLSALYLMLTWSRKKPISFHKNEENQLRKFCSPEKYSPPP